MMKKIFFAIASAIMLFGVNALAAPGDVIGNVYPTDIVTYMYYAPITSYNIGGKTCIDAEILNWHYGFDVYWLADERHLDIDDKGGRFVSLQAMSGEIVESSKESPQSVGKYYETDIITTLNGNAIESYNIGGRTVICAEAMRDFGYNVDWDPEKRTLTISKPMDFYKYETDYGTIRSMYDYKLPRGNNLVFLNRGVIVTKDEKQYMLSTPSNKIYGSPGGTTYIKLSDLEGILGGKCSMQEATTTSTSEWVNGITDTYEQYAYSFNLNYDTSVEPELKEYIPEEYENIRADVSGENFFAVDLFSVAMTINEEEYSIKAMGRGKEYTSALKVVLGEVYIPAYNVAVILGYDYAW